MSAKLVEEIANRVILAGLKIVRARIFSFAYAPEVAQAMPQRQRAGAVIVTHEQIVKDTVIMIDRTLKRLENSDIIELDDERKARVVSNLLVVLCSDTETQPVVDIDSLYWNKRSS